MFQKDSAPCVFEKKFIVFPKGLPKASRKPPEKLRLIRVCAGASPAGRSSRKPTGCFLPLLGIPLPSVA